MLTREHCVTLEGLNPLPMGYRYMRILILTENHKVGGHDNSQRLNIIIPAYIRGVQLNFLADPVSYIVTLHVELECNVMMRRIVISGGGQIEAVQCDPENATHDTVAV